MSFHPDWELQQAWSQPFSRLIYAWQRKVAKAAQGECPSPKAGSSPCDIEAQRDKEIPAERCDGRVDEVLARIAAGVGATPAICSISSSSPRS